MAAFYVASAYEEHVYHHILLQGSMPLIYNVDKLDSLSKQIISCTIVTQNYVKRMPKTLTLILTMHDQTVLVIKPRCAIQDGQHYALYLSNLAINS